MVRTPPPVVLVAESPDDPVDEPFPFPSSREKKHVLMPSFTCIWRRTVSIMMMMGIQSMLVTPAAAAPPFSNGACHRLNLAEFDHFSYTNSWDHQHGIVGTAQHHQHLGISRHLVWT